MPGQILDPETGFHYNYHRYYDPRTGRYLTPDPIGLVGGINLYTYVLNNPVNEIDPLGLTQWDIEVALHLVRRTQIDLIHPRNINTNYKSDKYAGYYNAITKTIHLNEMYLDELTDKQAKDLLDTVLHETLHANDPILKQFFDQFRDHPDIENEATRRLKEIVDMYLKERKEYPCP